MNININDSIKDRVKKQMEKSALAKRCPGCRTVGKLRVDKVIEGINLISKTRMTAAKRDFDHPVFLVFMICLQCGNAQKETVQPLQGAN